MKHIIFLALLVSVSGAECDPASDASCPSGGDSADADVMLQTRSQFRNKDPQDSCGAYDEPSCPAECEWFNHVCQTPCALFKSGSDCPARCDWGHGKCTEHGLANGNAAYSGADKSAPVPTTEDEGTHKSMEKQFGPGADFILALPMVLQNLSKVSSMITVSQDKKNAGDVRSDHKFGDANKDKAFLLDNVAGFFTTLHADSHAKASGATTKCPKNDVTVIKPCVELALCEVQSHLDENPKIKKSYLAIYSLLEQLAAGFADITFGLLDTSLKHEAGSSVLSFDTFQATDSFLETSHYACASGATVLVQEDDSNEAYHTSAVLQAAAKATHTVLDSHSQNSSAEATLEALHQAWKPSCELLNCDHTNYFDLYGASHVHSLALIEAGASGQHMRTHIRTRHRLEVRMMRFLSQHGTQFSKDGLSLYQAEGTQTDARLKHYYSLLREPLMSFAENYPKTKTEDELMALSSKQVMKRFYEQRQAVDDGSQGDLGNDDSETQVAEGHQDDQLDDSELDTGLSEIAEEAATAGRRRRRRWLRRRRRRWFIQKAVQTVVKAVNTAWKFIMDTFACIGKSAVITGYGYGKKFWGEDAVVGVGVSMTMQDSLSSLGTFMQGRMVRSLSFGVGVVIGAVPYSAMTGGSRSGVGIGGRIGCGTTGCSVGISVGAMAAALFPGVLCPAGAWLVAAPPIGFGCFSSYGVTVSIMCCTHNFVTGSNNCR